MICPVCRKYEFEDWNDICSVCGWENDRTQQRSHNLAGGANSLSVNEARIEYFLLNCELTREKAMIRRKLYDSELKIINEGLETPFTEEYSRECDMARFRYIDRLNELLQSINSGKEDEYDND